MDVVIIVLIVLIAVVLGILTMRDGSRERRVRFRDREDLPMDVIYERFFRSSGLPQPLVVELWGEVAHRLGISPGKLRPSDRFDRELGAVEDYDDDIADVQWTAERRLKRCGTTADLSRIETLGDYVQFFGNLAAQ